MEPELHSPSGKYATARTIDGRNIRSFKSKGLLLTATRLALGRNHPPIQRAREVFLALEATVEAECLLSLVAEFRQPLHLYLHFLIRLRGIAFN